MKTQKSKVQFEKQEVSVIKSEEGNISLVCLEDICIILQRRIMMETGEATAICQTACKVQGTTAYYIKPHDIFKLTTKVRKENKMMKPVCDKVDDWVGKTLIPQKQITIRKEKEISKDPVSFECNGNPISFQVENNKLFINGTQLSRLCDKSITAWLMLKPVKEFQIKLVNKGFFRNIDEQTIKIRGAKGITWLEQNLALEFAKSMPTPELYAWLLEKINDLNNSGYYNISQKPIFFTKKIERKKFTSLEEAQKAHDELQDEHAELLQFYDENKEKIGFYDETVGSRTWFTSTAIANELNTSSWKLHRFLIEKNIGRKEGSQFVAYPSHAIYQCEVGYPCENKKTGKIYEVGKNKRWTPEGRLFIRNEWKKEHK